MDEKAQLLLDNIYETLETETKNFTEPGCLIIGIENAGENPDRPVIELYPGFRGFVQKPETYFRSRIRRNYGTNGKIEFNRETFRMCYLLE